MNTNRAASFDALICLVPLKLLEILFFSLYRPVFPPFSEVKQ